MTTTTVTTTTTTTTTTTANSTCIMTATTQPIKTTMATISITTPNTTISDLIERAQIIRTELADNEHNDSTSIEILNEITKELTKNTLHAPKEELKSLLKEIKELQAVKNQISSQFNKQSKQNVAECYRGIKESAIPKFDGKILTYARFRKQFFEIVINSSEPNAVKYEYLKQATKESSRATEIIANATDEETVEQIFDKLDTEFDSPSVVFNEIFQQIQKCPKFHSALDFKGWDSVYNILSKTKQRVLDPVLMENIKHQIMAKLPSDSIPHLRVDQEANLEFITNYALEMREATLKLKPQMPETSSNTRRQFPKQLINCVLCKQNNHKVDKCPKMPTTDLQSLIKTLKEAKVCMKCGMHTYKHDRPCLITCNKCSGNHATYLCKNNSTTSSQVNQIQLMTEQNFPLPDQQPTNQCQ